MDNTSLFRLIGTISRQATREVNQQVKKYNLDNNLFLYLLRIIENPGLTQFELIQLVQVDKTTMSRSLKKLIDRDYIQKKVNPENKNFKKLFPTEKALNLQKNIAGIEKNYIDEKLKGLTNSQKVALSQILLNIEGSSFAE